MIYCGFATALSFSQVDVKVARQTLRSMKKQKSGAAIK